MKRIGLTAALMVLGLGLNPTTGAAAGHWPHWGHKNHHGAQSHLSKNHHSVQPKAAHPKVKKHPQA
jgi:hypothetical protein